MASAVRLVAKLGASQRTKNRIREGGPHFILGREMPTVLIEGKAVRARLAYSVSTDWVGWFPSDEVEVDL